MTGIGGLIGLYLTKRVLEDYHIHERRENVFLRLLSEKTQQFGIDLDVSLKRRRPIGWRNFWLQVFVFPSLTLGLYAFWVIYYIFEDGTSHAKHHCVWETYLLGALAKDNLTVGADVPSAELCSARPLSVSEMMAWGSSKMPPDSVSGAIQGSGHPAFASVPTTVKALPEARLQQLAALREQDLITEEEYRQKKRQILEEL